MNSKKKILIVDDSEINRSLLSDILCEQFDMIETENGIEAAEILQKQEQDIALILLDIVMPKMDGFEFLELMNQKGWIKTIPVIMISSENIPSYMERAYSLGALEYISRPFDERTVQHRVVTSIMFSSKEKELTLMLTEQMIEKEKSNRMMVEILSNLVEFRNGESGMHVLHIQTITQLLLDRLMEKTDRYPLEEKDRQIICMASALHDIGKIVIPSKILNKPGRLTDEEFAIMKTHSAEGAEFLTNLPFGEEEPLIRYAYQICRWHHERYDGRGYPDGLTGDDIPIAAQVVSVADVYDALTSKRVYKDAFSPEKAVHMILNGECGTFNPLLLECLVDIAPILKEKVNDMFEERHSEKEIMQSVDRMMKANSLTGSYSLPD